MRADQYRVQLRACPQLRAPWKIWGGGGRRCARIVQPAVAAAAVVAVRCRQVYEKNQRGAKAVVGPARRPWWYGRHPDADRHCAGQSRQRDGEAQGSCRWGRLPLGGNAPGLHVGAIVRQFTQCENGVSGNTEWNSLVKNVLELKQEASLPCLGSCRMTIEPLISALGLGMWAYLGIRRARPRREQFKKKFIYKRICAS